MVKIRKIKFINHPILKNLELNFCNSSNEVVDTIILAGENGTGKSTVLDCLYKISSYQVNFEANVEVQIDNKICTIRYYKTEHNIIKVSDDESRMGKIEKTQTNSTFQQKYNFSGIFSDVDINFKSDAVQSVTSLELDNEKNSKRSNNDLPRLIKQLIIDIQALDDSDLSFEYRKSKKEGLNTNNINIEERMTRFTSAFNQMFDNLEYSRVENVMQHKEIIFTKNGIDIPIDSLSSGEKQIVYRGCFLLKDKNALNGAFVFIDEPEISLHPLWQQKIMNYYKNIFTDSSGKQTSQIFVVTHSPFIIHNKERKNDKVIVMQRNGNDILIADKPEYYKCDSIDVVKDAFNITEFSNTINSSKSTVYLEERTDEMYFNKALEVFGYINVPFIFKWVGYIDSNGQEANTGKDSLNKAAQFMISQNSPIKNIFLFDCDTNKTLAEENNVICKAIEKYENSKNIRKGIENALVLDDISLDLYYSTKTTIGDYAEEKIISQFDKMKCCEDICNMDYETLKKVFTNLKKEIDTLIDLF